MCALRIDLQAAAGRADVWLSERSPFNTRVTNFPPITDRTPPCSADYCASSLNGRDAIANRRAACSLKGRMPVSTFQPFLPPCSRGDILHHCYIPSTCYAIDLLTRLIPTYALPRDVYYYYISMQLYACCSVTRRAPPSHA